ncbi:polysaccharide biosynthesis tyrosine autokinase [Pengzhenrongella frigida]|uniref:Polysaccharide chain length determinant N-terminal domain-containing protein n=1 Tax=Pengzhenrongella frigida TaxID=1259133 RepID=A0A4Q5N2F5_9MICO|nr:hypothetical protein [Cellulomonas sp. HLT2-17]RYV50767.1 hypothetical protein EUA98_12005 [Cellulomonas sp. HLT2-17]
MTLRELVRTVRFSRWLVIVSVVLALAGAWLYLSRQEPAYVAHATVQRVGTEALAGAGVQLDSDPSLVSGADVATAAATALGDGRRAAEIAGRSTAAYAGATESLVTISVASDDPADAVAATNAVAAAYVAELQSRFDLEVAGLQSRLDVLGDSIEQNQAAVDASRAARGFNTVGGLLEAQYAASMDQYQTLLSQVAEANVLASPASVRQTASSAALSSVAPLTALLIAGLGGLFLGMGLAVARGGLDSKVRTAGGVRRAVGAPVLARLHGTAVARRGYERTGDLPVAIRTGTSYTQSVRELRTAVQAAMDGGTGAVIVVTSADLEAPRSFFAANLAASWALSGRSVIVLSGDLRQPRLNAMLPAQEGSSRKAPARAARGPRSSSTVGLAPARTSIPRLSIHPELRTELDPADFLASDEVRDLVQRLRAAADVVIIDSPPMLVAADASILGGYADGVLLAATIGQTETAAIEESADRLRAANARLLGIVLDGGRERRGTHAASYPFTGDSSTPAPEGPPEPARSSKEPAAAPAAVLVEKG